MGMRGTSGCRLVATALPHPAEYRVCGWARTGEGRRSQSQVTSKLVDKCNVTGYGNYQVQIRNFIHKGLKRLYEEDSKKGVPPDSVDKLRKMLAFLDDMEDPDELRALPSWRAHLLVGDREGTRSLSVTRNRRLTFWIDRKEWLICDVDL